MSCRSESQLKSQSKLIAALLSSAALMPAAANGQSAQELPPIVVEGATLDVPKAAALQQEPASTNPANEGAKKQKVAGDAAGQSDTQIDAAQAGGAGGVAPTGEADGVPIEKLGTSVSVVTGEQLKAQQIRHAADALRSLPGVSVSGNGGPGTLTVVRIRGAESNHTLVLIDGVEVNSGSEGFFDFSNLTAEDIARIEVLRGPQSGLYGSGALGGVINIITKAGKGPLTVRASAEAGSFNTQGASAQVSGGNDRLHGSLSVSGRRTDGFNLATAGNEKDASHFQTISFNGGVMVLDNLALDGVLRLSQRHADRDGFNATLDGFSVIGDDGSELASQLFVGRLQATLDTFDHHWTHKLFVNRANTDTKDWDRDIFFPLGLTETNSENTSFGYTSTYRLDSPGSPVRHFLTGQIEQLQERFEQPTFSTETFVRDRTSFVGEVRGEYFDTLFLTGTIRQDQNDLFDDFTTWRAAASLKVPQTVFRLHGSVGTGVKYPSFSELFGFFFGFEPNPDLVPEQSLGWDTGVETTLFGGRGVLDVTYFDANLKDEIDFTFNANGNFEPFNRTGESRRRGIEVAGRFALISGLTLGGAYTYLDATEDSGEQEVRRPRHSGRADINYAFDGGRGNVNVAAIYNGTMPDIVFDLSTFTSARAGLEDFWLLNVAASYKIAPGVEIYGRVENLLDQDYQEVFGYETADIAAYAGLRFTYEDQVTVAWGRNP